MSDRSASPASPGRFLFGSGLIAMGLIAAVVGTLVALPEHGDVGLAPRFPDDTNALVLFDGG